MCNDGFYGDNGTVCYDVDECDMELDDCHVRANRFRERSLASEPLLLHYGVTCLPRQPGMTSLLPTQANATCHNFWGSFNCSCNAGYEGNGTFCEDIDECLLMEDNCHVSSSSRPRPKICDANCLLI
jgi:hypothetical protein